jgi:hypothetical protein
MVFHVTMVSFSMTIPTNEFTIIVGPNLLLVHSNVEYLRAKVWYIMHIEFLLL